MTRPAWCLYNKGPGAGGRTGATVSTAGCEVPAQHSYCAMDTRLPGPARQAEGRTLQGPGLHRARRAGEAAGAMRYAVNPAGPVAPRTWDMGTGGRMSPRRRGEGGRGPRAGSGRNL